MVRMSVKAWAVAAVVAAGALSSVAIATDNSVPDPAPADSTTQAVWKAKEFKLTYMGFTTKYSCEGLADKVKTILLTLGARKDDLHVTETGCIEAFRPSPFPGVRVKMSVLEPVSDQSGAASTEDRSAAATGSGSDAIVTAHWKPVQLKLDADSVTEAGECELVEQIRRQVLPLFAARDVKFGFADCVPHQLLPSERLHATVLVPPVAPKP
jgi:hypothetical protein